MYYLAVINIILGLVFGGSAVYRLEEGNKHPIVLIQLVAAAVLLVSGFVNLKN